MRQGLVFSIVVLITFCAPAWAYDWSTNPGDGSDTNPYQISTPVQLMSIGSNHDQHFILTNDIVFDPNNNSSHIFEFPVIHEFGGSLNGSGYTIYNFTIVSDFFGFEVGFIRSHYGVLENINFKNANITIGHDSFDVGVLCGISRGRIENCSVSGQITINGASTRIGGLVGRNYYDVWDCKSSVSILHNNGYVYDIGGLIGFNEGMIEHCEASCTIESINSDISERVGGLVGWNDGPILDCHATGDIYGDYRIGGLVGENRGGWSAIAGCSAEGKVTVFGENGGGFVGYNSGTIFSSLSRASVLGLEFLGGFAGVNDGRISNCYSTGSITAPPVNEPGDVYRVRGLGGFTGVNLGNIEYSYSAGNVYADEFALDNGWVGGFVAGNAGKVTSCFWDVELQTHGVTESIGVSDGGTVIYTAGLLTSLMQQGDTFIDAGWNFAKKWWIDEANDYPRLWFEKNMPPVADAGADQRVFAFGVGFVDVQLDGNGSSDGDDDPLEYFWFNDANELIAEGAEPNVVLPIGEHVIDLVVNDGVEDSEPDSCVVTVVEASKVSMNLTPLTLNCRSQGNWIKAHFILPEAYLISDIDSDGSAIVHSYGIESALLEVSVNKEKCVEITASFDRKQICSLAGDWPGIFRVYGFFTDGTVFLGESGIRINPAGLKEVSELASYWLLGDCGHPDWCDGLDLNRDLVVNMQDYPLLLRSEVEFTSE